MTTLIIKKDLTIPEEIHNICGLQGIFYIEFLKKDKAKYLDDGTKNPNYNKNTIKRTGNFRLGVKKHLKGKKRTTDKQQYMIAFDMKKQGYRNILYEEIKFIKAGGKEYEVTTKTKIIGKRRFRLSLIKNKNDEKQPEQLIFDFGVKQ